MRSILNESDRADIVRRLGTLSAASARQWGSMDVAGMLQHLRLSTDMALGGLQVPSVNKRLLQMFPLKHLVIYVFPFPKGAPTAPELIPNAAGSALLDEERNSLIELLERLGTGPHEGAGPVHPLFGPMTWRQWGVATYKHANHHLKQFGA